MRRRSGHALPLGHVPSVVRVVASRVASGSLVLGLASVGAVVLPGPAAGAATDTVANCSGSAATTGSLPYVVQNANAGDTVSFSVSCPPSSPIVVASPIVIGVDLTIDGPGSTLLAVSGNNTSAVFTVASGVTATVSGLTVEDGRGLSGGGVENQGIVTITASTVTANNTSDGGGGIENDGGTLTVSDSTVSRDDAYRGGGGGIRNDGGTLTVVDSTFSHDGAFYGPAGIGGGAIFDDGGSADIYDSTFAKDSSDYNGGGGGVFTDGGTVDVTATTFSHDITFRHGGGGGIGNDGGTVSAAGTIVADSGAGGDCAGVVTDAGYNLDDDGSCGFSATNQSDSGVDPYLGPLQNNGGPTLTEAPALGSPVLDQIPLGTTANGTTLCRGADQRGVSRPQGSGCDIGAVELSPTSQTITSRDSATASVDQPFTFDVTTTGTPAPVLTENPKLPKRLRFAPGSGTAVISGRPKAAGTSRVTIRATFGTGPSRFVVTQLFTLTVNPA